MPNSFVLHAYDRNCREASDCDKKKITERVLDKSEKELLKAAPAHLVSDVNKDELQKRVS